jgi:hypothetical protein
VVEAGIWTITKRINALVNDATLEWTTGASKATFGIYATTYGSRDRWDIGNDLLLTAKPHARRLNMTLADGRAVTRDGFTSGASFLVDASYSGNDLAFYGVEELKVTDRLRIDGGPAPPEPCRGRHRRRYAPGRRRRPRWRCAHALRQQ